MASLRQIRRRIRSVQNTQQITRAMEMVAAAKLKRAQAQLFATRPYADKMDELLSHVSASTGEYTHPLLEKRVVKTVALAIVIADKGMCGAYNINIIRHAETFLKNLDKSNSPNSAQDKKAKLILIGKRGITHFRKRNWEIISTWSDFGGKVDYGKTKDIATQMMSLFLLKEVDEVYLLYTKFISGMTYRPYMIKLLNIENFNIRVTGKVEQDLGEPSLLPQHRYDYLFEPSAEQLLDILLPRYITTRVYIALAESFTSEHSARMVAMRNATDNADEMIDRLTLLRNKLRQASITKEITEIVSGAEALTG